MNTNTSPQSVFVSDRDRLIRWTLQRSDSPPTLSGRGEHQDGTVPFPRSGREQTARIRHSTWEWSTPTICVTGLRLCFWVWWSRVGPAKIHWIET